MGLDIVLFRADQGGNPDLIRESQRKRFAPVELVDKVIELDQAWRKARFTLDQTNAERGKLNKEIGELKKAGKDAVELLQKRGEVEKQIEALEKDVVRLGEEVENTVRQVGNIVHASVPVSDNEDNNGIVKKWGEFKQKPLHHHELLFMIDGYDAPRGSKVAGHRGYFLKGVGVKLNMAIIQYALDFLEKRKFTHLQTPFFMKKEPMGATAQLSQFDEELYKVIGGAKDEEHEKYLIATSEQPISAFHQNEWLDPKDMPLRYSGYSTCFRKEAGAYGKDTWGIFRVHQFEKIEQFCLTSPETSWEMHEEMLKNAEEFYQSLNIPYQVVAIVSGALNNAAAKKYDLEGWFPGFNTFRELVSCSNCTDYQSRPLEIRYGYKKQNTKEKKYAHLLNSTLAATTRVICAILENYQTEKGIEVPAVLQPYMGGLTFIPFVKESPRDEEKEKKGGKK